MRGVPIILRSAVVCAVFGVAVPVQGQYLHSTGYDSIFHAWELRELNQTAHASASVARDRAIVSADELRHPLSSKARHSLEDAKRKGESGDHSAAIEALRKSLIKYPASAPYAYNLLGREYMESGDFVKAQESFEEATKLMPHESAHHSNLGLSLAILGRWDRAEEEVGKALQLDRANAKAKQILEAMKLWKSNRADNTNAAFNQLP